MEEKHVFESSPIIFLEEHALQIAECKHPAAFRWYILLWRHLDNDFTVTVRKKWVVEDQSISWTIFKNEIRALSRLGLVSWVEVDDVTWQITFIDPTAGQTCA